MRHKGTVFESGDKWAVLLMPGGEFKKIKTKQRLHIGQMYSPVARASYRSMAAAAIIIITLAFSFNFMTVAAWARLSPGVELGVNSWGRVVSIKTKGVQGENLTAGMLMWGKSVEEVLPVLLERAMQQVCNAPQEDIVVKVEVQGGYWPRGRSGLEHINESLRKYNDSNDQGRLVNQEDPQSWLWQNYNMSASENGEGQSNTSKATDVNNQVIHKEKHKTGNAPEPEDEKGSNKGNNPSDDNNKNDSNGGSSKNSNANGSNVSQGTNNSSDRGTQSGSINNPGDNGNGNNSDNDGNKGNSDSDETSDTNNTHNNSNGSKHANKSKQSEKDRQKFQS